MRFLRRPCLSRFKLDRVLLCWDGRRSAARAIADAAPLLKRSKSVEIITVANKDDNRGEISGADIAHHSRATARKST
jgi:hypothetical protein